MSNKCDISLQSKLLSRLSKSIVKSDGKEAKVTSWESALELVRFTLKNNSYTLANLKNEFEPSIYEKIENIFRSLNYDFSASKKQIKDAISNRTTSNINIVFNSPLITSLFSNFHVAEKYFEKRLNHKIVEAVILGFDTDDQGNPIKTYVSSNSQLNENIKTLKNKLFKDIVDYLINLGAIKDESKYYKEEKFIANLYDFSGKFKNYDLYKSTLKLLESVMLGGDSYDNSVKNIFDEWIPDLTANITSVSDRLKLDAYNAAVMLVNFDNILNKYYNKFIWIDPRYFNDFQYRGDDAKYKIKPEGQLEEFWKNDEHMSESVEEIRDQMSDAIIESIPTLDVNGNFTGFYLDRRDLYSLASFFKNLEILNFNNFSDLQDVRQKEIEGLLENDPDFEVDEYDYHNWKLFSEDPIFMLKWYVNNILNNYEKSDWDKNNTFNNRENGVSFHNKIGVLKSLEAFINKIDIKEENTNITILGIISQVLNNSVGANYTTYNQNTGKLELQEMHSHNATRVDLQNSVYSHLLQRVTNEDLFWVDTKGIDPEEEKEKIKNLVDTNQKLSNFIYQKLGIYLGIEGTSKLRNLKINPELSKEANEYNFASYIRSFLIPIRSKTPKSEDSILEMIKTNENEISDLTKAEVKSKAEIINELSDTIQDILDIFLENQPMRAIMTTTMSTGEKIPTFKLINLMYDDASVLKQRLETERKEVVNFNSLFLKHGGLLGTSTKLEALHDDSSKTAFEWSSLEAFTANFQFDFLDVFRPTSKVRGINVMIGNYSDKNSILSKIIDKHVKQGSKFIIGHESGKDIMSMTDVLQLFRNQSKNFYTDVLNNIFDQYGKLGLELNKITNHTTQEKLVKENINRINTFLQSFKNLDSFLLNNREKSLLDNTINITSELHYSAYEGKLSLNQIIIDNYFIYKDNKNFDKLVEKTEKSLTDKLLKLKGNILFDEKTADKFDKNGFSINKMLTTFGIDKDNFNKSFIKEGNILVVNKSGKINPLLKRAMWINNLFLNEYLFITTKPEYMHPFKGKDKESKELKFRGNEFIDVSNENHWDEFFKESNYRLPNMSKRNVSFTATYEIPIRNYRLGIPNKVNGAIINDSTAILTNLFGKSYRQDVHDGSTWINYIYARMIEESFPTKSYKGTKKEIGTFISDYGSSLKKDAEFVITNNRMLDSKDSDIKLKDKHKQMLSAFNLPDGFKYTSSNLPFIGFYKDVDYYKINTFKIENNQIFINAYKYNNQSKDFNIILPSEIVYNVNSLYDIWEALGGMYSVDKNLNFSEGSNDLIYDIVTNYVNEEGKYILKDQMIHFISNATSFKSGQINLNPSSLWTNDEKLTYSTFNNQYLGPQLDANHTADESKIKEITQIISALAQSPLTAKIADEVYRDIARIIKESSVKYNNVLKEKLTDKEFENFYNTLSRGFAHELANSDGVSLAKTIASTFGNTLIPFSNQHFFREFTRNMITKMNNEFITRYYPGLGLVINPSHGIIKVYEDEKGVVYKQQDLLKKILLENLNSPNKVIGTTDEIFNEYIRRYFPDKEVTVGEINPWDTVIVDGQPKTLSTVKEYYDFKNGRNPWEKVTKVYSATRDLKPEETTFKIDGLIRQLDPITKEPIVTKVIYQLNLFDLDPLKLRNSLENLMDKKQINEFDLNVLVSFSNNFNISIADVNNITQDEFDEISKKLNQWTNRITQLLNDKKIMIPVDQLGVIDFKSYFNGDNLSLNWEDAKHLYNEKNTIDIMDYNHKSAEAILPNMHKTSFNIKDDTIHDITGPEYFRNQMEEDFSDDDTDADLKFVLGDENKNVYIKFVHNLPNKKRENNNLFLTEEVDGKRVQRRVDSKGKPLYIKPENTLIINEDNVDVIYWKITNEEERVILNEDGTSKISKIRIIDNNLTKNLNYFVDSFKENVYSIVPLMNNSNTNLTLNSLNKDLKKVNTNRIVFNIFSHFHNYKRKDSNDLNNEWLIKYKEDILNSLSTKKFASWQKHLEIISARIPAQSMQSFMKMKNIGYFNSDTNDGYVSVFQIWYQGSDFDIDKSYTMGYGFNKNGHYDVWSPLFDYSSKQELDAMEKLPLPNNKDTEIEINNTDNSDTELVNFISTFFEKTLTEQEILLNFTPQLIEDFDKVLRKTNTNEDDENNKLKISSDLYNKYKDLLDTYLKFIDTHNSSKEYIYKRNSIRNSIVSKIGEIITTPSNLLYATAPINIDSVHRAAEKSMENQEKERIFSLDFISKFKQQEDASVGKADVGISANGGKVLFALSNYYNNWQSSLGRRYDFIKYYSNNKLFLKEFSINGKQKAIHSIANTNVNSDYVNFIMNQYGFDELQKENLKIDSEIQAALEISAMISASTDNAKELVMAKINAVTELASMHLYLMSLGYGIEDIAVYMNSKLGKYVANKIKGNVFETSKDVFINTILKSYLTENEGAENEINQFKEIYEGAQEFKFLAQILKVNQKTAANIDELNKFLSNLETGMYSRENSVLEHKLLILRNQEKWDEKLKPDNKTVIELIIDNNNLLRRKHYQNLQLAELEIDNSKKEFLQTEVINYVKKILTEANSIEVSSVNKKGQTEKKTVSIIGGQFDFRYYMGEQNSKYRAAAINYYNLFKNTINVFDVINNSPHFKAMISGVSTIHNVLSKVSAKYNFAFSASRDIIKNNAQSIVSLNEAVTNRFGNAAFGIKIDDIVLSRLLVTFDKFVISKWLKEKETDKFRFNVDKLLKLAGLDSIILYKSNQAKNLSIGEIDKNPDLFKDSVIKIDSNTESNFVVDLKSDYGIANFKVIMEKLIFPILQKSESPISRTLKLGSVKNAFGLWTTQIMSTFPISDLNSPINLDKFQQLLSDFNKIDSHTKEEFKIKNAEGKLLEYKDLFYMYNLILNNESYGDKRLTPLFEDYIKNSNTIGYNFLSFYEKVDKNKISIFDIDMNIQSEEDMTMKNNLEKYLEQNIIFLALHKKARLRLEKSGEITLKNSNFPINTIMEESTIQDTAKYAVTSEIISVLKSRNLLINFICD